jgi:lipoprotein-anchoring transpeptidase ErfK/SrfK
MKAGMKRSPVRRFSVVAFAVLCLLASGCTATPVDGSHPGPSGSDPSSPTEPGTPRARIEIMPRGAKADPSGGISVTVKHGTLASVTVKADGEPVDGHFGDGHESWATSWALTTDTRYVVRASAIDVNGQRVTRTAALHTLVPEQTFSTTIFEGYHKMYGVGMPIILQFSAPITNKAAVERSLEVRTSRPAIGAWYWDGDQTLYFRPRMYWKEDTNVDFVGHLDGVEGAPGVFGVHTLTQSWTIGRSLISVANTQTHDVKIYLHKKLFGDWPMSAGKPGDDTPNGTYLSIEKHNPEEMIGPGYDILVPYSVRFTLSGDFMHDAFWSVNDQGFTNVSHGCINLSPENATTYYNMSVPGDPITVEGSPRAGTWGNGWTVWFLTWKDYLKGSALHMAVRTSRSGSRFVPRSSLRPVNAKPPLATSKPGNADASIG